MRVRVINRAADAARWRAVAASFAAAAPVGWTLTRVAAVEAEAAACLPGRLRAAEKACFESHRRLVAGPAGAGEALFVCEDDVVFSAEGLALVEAALAGDSGWDVLFTDIGIGDIAGMIRLARLRRQLVAAGKVTLLDLAKATWFGTSAYVVRGQARAKLAGLLAAAPLDAPYDITLRRLIRDGALAGQVMFPFVTTVSDAADRSAVQAADSAGTDAVWNAFRRLMWIGRDLEAAQRDAAAITGDRGDAESAVLGTLIGAILDPGFRWK